MYSLKQDLTKYIGHVKSRQDLMTEILNNPSIDKEDLELIKEKMESIQEPVNLISRLMTKTKLLEDSLDISMNVNKTLVTLSDENRKEHSLIEPYRSPIKEELENKINIHLKELSELRKQVDEV
jgi:hypothetical protein